MAQTDTPGEERDQYSYRLAGSYNSENWRYQLNYTEVAAGFNPEVGFLRRGTDGARSMGEERTTSCPSRTFRREAPLCVQYVACSSV